MTLAPLVSKLGCVQTGKVQQIFFYKTRCGLFSKCGHLYEGFYKTEENNSILFGVVDFFFSFAELQENRDEAITKETLQTKEERTHCLLTFLLLHSSIC